MRHAFTMVEMVVSIAVLAIVAAIILPVIGGATDAYASSVALRDGSERMAFAMERCTRLIRDWPVGATNLTVASAKFDGQSTLIFADGRGLTLAGTDLMLIDESGTSSVLCRQVKSFQIELLQADGVSSAAADTTTTQRVNITLITTEAELRTTAFLRARAVSS